MSHSQTVKTNQPMIINNTFDSPYFIFIKTSQDKIDLILEKLELLNWTALNSVVNDGLIESENRHFFVTWIDGWFHIMDDWNYTLWFDSGLIQRIQNLSNLFEIFTCSIGDCDYSFDFRLFKDGEIKREFVVEDPNINGGVVTKNFGDKLQGEEEALEKKDILERVISIAQNIGITTNYNLDKIRAYWRAEFESEKFIFDETEY